MRIDTLLERRRAAAVAMNKDAVRLIGDKACFILVNDFCRFGPVSGLFGILDADRVPLVFFEPLDRKSVV